MVKVVKKWKILYKSFTNWKIERHLNIWTNSIFNKVFSFMKQSLTKFYENEIWQNYNKTVLHKTSVMQEFWFTP